MQLKIINAIVQMFSYTEPFLRLECRLGCWIHNIKNPNHINNWKHWQSIPNSPSWQRCNAKINQNACHSNLRAERRPHKFPISAFWAEWYVQMMVAPFQGQCKILALWRLNAQDRSYAAQDGVGKARKVEIGQWTKLRIPSKQEWNPVRLSHRCSTRFGSIRYLDLIFLVQFQPLASIESSHLPASLAEENKDQEPRREGWAATSQKILRTIFIFP